MAFLSPKPEHHSPPSGRTSQEREEREGFDRVRQSRVMLVGQSQLKEEAYSCSLSLEKQFESVRGEHPSALAEQFEVLRRIISKECPMSEFDGIHDSLASRELN